jgi:hypothetical protein
LLVTAGAGVSMGEAVGAFVACGLLIFLAGAAGGVKWKTGQVAIQENIRLEAERERARANRATEQQMAKDVIGAVNDARKREQVARAAATATRTERDGLRDDLTAIRANLPSDSLDACRQRATTLAELFDQCAGRLEGLAGKAQRHAEDTLMLEQAWPKKE